MTAVTARERDCLVWHRLAGRPASLGRNVALGPMRKGSGCRAKRSLGGGSTVEDAQAWARRGGGQCKRALRQAWRREKRRSRKLHLASRRLAPRSPHLGPSARPLTLRRTQGTLQRFRARRMRARSAPKWNRGWVSAENPQRRAISAGKSTEKQGANLAQIVGKSPGFDPIGD